MLLGLLFLSLKTSKGKETSIYPSLHPQDVLLGNRVIPTKRTHSVKHTPVNSEDGTDGSTCYTLEGNAEVWGADHGAC